MLDVEKIRDMFPMYKNHPNLVYLDTSATSLKPQVVLDKMNEYYSEYGVNIHRGVYELSYKATDEYDKARYKVADFINAKFQEIIFTRNVSSSLNFVSLSYGMNYIKENDEVITCELEHHSSVLPWQQLCKRKGTLLRYIKLDEEGRITIDEFKKVLNKNTKVVALTYVSNVMGYISPIKEIIKLAHEVGAIVIVDAAQAVPHMKVDVKDLDCDFLAFSGHKMFGPTGIGVLYGKEKILNSINPVEYGGDMNDDVFLDDVVPKELPYKFETGTPPIAEVIGLGKSIDFINEIGIENIEKHCRELHQYALSKLEKVDGLTIYNKTAEVAIISFNVNGVHPHDAITIFDEYNIAMRAGHHCAQLITKWLKCIGTLRASLYIYNDYNDIDKFVNVLKEVVEYFKQFEGEVIE